MPQIRKMRKIGTLKEKVNEMKTHISIIEAQIKHDTEERLVIQKSLEMSSQDLIKITSKLQATRRKNDEVSSKFTKMRAIVEEVKRIKEEEKYQ